MLQPVVLKALHQHYCEIVLSGFAGGLIILDFDLNDEGELHSRISVIRKVSVIDAANAMIASSASDSHTLRFIRRCAARRASSAHS